MATAPTAPQTRKAALRRARELYDQFCARAERDGPFHFTDYLAALGEALGDWKKIAYEGFVRQIGETVDSHATKEDEQPVLFDLDGVYKLGDGRRQPKRTAQIQHADEAIAIKSQNVAAVLSSLAKDQAELAKLRPFWPMGTPRHQAVAAYREAHPEET